jgi:dGTPase
MDEARNTLKELFEAYFSDSSLLPEDHKLQVLRAGSEGGKSACARVVADYVAGMTDRFAITERNRLKNFAA